METQQLRLLRIYEIAVAGFCINDFSVFNDTQNSNQHLVLLKIRENLKPANTQICYVMSKQISN